MSNKVEDLIADIMHHHKLGDIEQLRDAIRDMREAMDLFRMWELGPAAVAIAGRLIELDDLMDEAGERMRELARGRATPLERMIGDSYNGNGAQG